MHLPAPLRAAVGLVVTAAGEVRTLPDRAVELPMLAVSRALQVSLRAQQRYAQLAERGDQVLNGGRPGDEPPAWATFDDPLTTDDLHRTALAQLEQFADEFDAASAADEGSVADRGPRRADIFGDLSDGSGNHADETETATTGTVTPITEAPGSSARKTARKTARKAAGTSPVRKAAATKTVSKKAVTTKAPAKKAPAKKAPATKADPALRAADDAGTEGTREANGKPVSKPRHTAPSKFDDAGD